MPQYFDMSSIAKIFGIPIKKVSQIIKIYKDVIKPSSQSTDVRYYALDDVEIINEIYHKTILGKLEKQIREELKLPEKKEKKIKPTEKMPAKTIDTPIESQVVLEIKDAEVKKLTKSKIKGVDNILFELFKARLQEYNQNGFITKSQFNELVEYEKSKVE